MKKKTKLRKQLDPVRMAESLILAAWAIEAQSKQIKEYKKREATNSLCCPHRKKVK